MFEVMYEAPEYISVMLLNTHTQEFVNLDVQLTGGVALEARVLYPPEAFIESWDDLKNWLDVHTHFGWPASSTSPVGRLRPTSTGISRAIRRCGAASTR